jgi:branched-chain amino acid transport system substrate-binding protein
LKKRGASTATVGALFIVGLLVGAGVVYLAAPSLISSSTQTITAAGGTVTITGSTATMTETMTSTATATGASSGLCNGQTITIGALNDLSGQLSAQGKGDLAAEQLAIQDVNSFVQASGCSLTFALNAQDYKLDNPTALSELQAMYSSGVQVVIGPLNSGTAQYILNTADSDHVVLISPSSTSAALGFLPTASAPKYLFRTAPNDAAQGAADAREMVSLGAQGVIIINRDDTYGDGLANSTYTDLIHDGVSASNIKGPYKYNTATTDFTSLISQIASDYTSLTGSLGAAHVAIYAVSFQEVGSLLLQAQTQAPQLLTTTLPWFGCDGTAQNSLLTNATTSGKVVSDVRLPSTLFNVVNNSKTIDFYTRIKGTAAGAAILGGGAFYTFEGYDDVWLAALSVMSAGKNDGTAIHNVMTTVSDNFYGLTGWEGLAPDQDRIPGSYQIWKVVAVNGAYNWVLAGTWDFSSDSMTWTSPP